jgi:hypothetical protein
MESNALTHTAGLTMPPFASGEAGCSNRSIGQMAARAIQAVVPGYAAGDGKRYAESLKRSFNFELKDGYQSIRWAPASVGGATNPADLTGAVANFYHHASARISQAREELRKLEPMCAADHEDCCEDIRQVIGAKLDELEIAFSADCGPCEEWVDGVFTLLIGDDADEEPPPAADANPGLIGTLEDDYIEEDSAFCPGEETRLAKIRLFRSAMISLCDEWHRFANEFIRGENRSAVQIVRVVEKRSVVISKSIGIIRNGLLSAGFTSELLTVELLDEEEERNGTAVDQDEDRESLTACCALTRLETFCTSTSRLLSAPGVGAFTTLAAESEQLVDVACRVRVWLMKKFDHDKRDDECLSKKLDGTTPGWLMAVESTGAFNLAFRGVMAAAFTLWQQMGFLRADLETLLPDPCVVVAEKDNGKGTKTSQKPKYSAASSKKRPNKKR